MCFNRHFSWQQQDNVSDPTSRRFDNGIITTFSPTVSLLVDGCTFYNNNFYDPTKVCSCKSKPCFILLPPYSITFRKSRGYAIFTLGMLDIMNTCLIDNSFYNNAPVVVLQNTFMAQNNFGTADSGVSCQFLADLASPANSGNATCTGYDSSVCMAGTCFEIGSKASKQENALSSIVPSSNLSSV